MPERAEQQAAPVWADGGYTTPCRGLPESGTQTWNSLFQGPDATGFSPNSNADETWKPPHKKKTLFLLTLPHQGLGRVSKNKKREAYSICVWIARKVPKNLARPCTLYRSFLGSSRNCMYINIPLRQCYKHLAERRGWMRDSCVFLGCLQFSTQIWNQ